MSTKAWIYLSIIMAGSIILFIIPGAILHTREPLRDFYFAVIAVCFIVQTIDRVESRK